MVKFLPNKEYFEFGSAINPKLDPIGFAESGYQLRQYLKRCIVATVDRNQKGDDLESALKRIKIAVPHLKGSPYLVRQPPLAHIYAKTEKDEIICLGELIDLF